LEKPDSFLNMIVQMIIIFLVSILFAGGYFLCNHSTFPLITENQQVRRMADSILVLSGNQVRAINYKQLKRLMKFNDCLLIDVRSATDYNTDHIPGAINIPASDLEPNDGLIEELSLKYDCIVTYCDNQNCMESLSMAYKLQIFFSEIYYYAGGWHDYQQSR